MTWLLGSLLAVLLPAFITLVFLNRKDNREALTARDLLSGKDKLIAQATRKVDDLASELTAVRKLLAAETLLRKSAESERNDAYRLAHERLVEQLQNSGVADAIALVHRLSVPRGVLADKTVPAGDPNRTDDDLINPGL